MNAQFPSKYEPIIFSCAINTFNALNFINDLMTYFTFMTISYFQPRYYFCQLPFYQNNLTFIMSSSRRHHNLDRPLREKCYEQINEQEIFSQDYYRLKECKERLEKLLISHSLKKPSFVAQYTILYKSYMIIVAFFLTIICNFVHLYYQNNLQSHNLLCHHHSNQSQKTWLNTNITSSRDWLQSVSLILPIKGKFSIVFFQLMILTSIQIIYQTIFELHYRFYQKKQRKVLNKNSINEKDAAAKAQKSQQQSSRQKIEEDREYFSANTVDKKINRQSVYYLLSQCRKLTTILQEVPQYEPSCKNQMKKQKSNYIETNFLYIFSLVYAQTIIWEGIIVKKWTSKSIHLAIILCCVVQFMIWNVINTTLQGDETILLGDNQLIQINSNYQISLGQR